MAARYEKSLDGYRAVAVTLVIIHHWCPPDFISQSLSLGMIGVTMFFVLSGFLITGILVRSKDSNFSALKIFKNFYIRRSLRIFPIYYLYILIIFVFAGIGNINLFLSCLTYTANFYFFSVNSWGELSAHLWSLAVEEQFYLIWPFFLLFSNKNAKLLLYGFLSIGFLSRIILYYAYPNYVFNAVLTPTCFDSFAMGGLLAIYTHYSSVEEKSKWFKILSLASAISLISFLTEIILKTPTLEITQRMYVSILSVWMINILYNGGKSLFKSILVLPPMVYLGKISYGIYLYHGGIIVLYASIQKLMYQHKIFVPFTHHTLLPWVGGFKQIILHAFFLILLSSASWYIIEKPLNKLKSRFSL